jgi:hypothetical protein
MTATPPRYRTLDRPGPGLATIQGPDGRVALWSLNLRGNHARPCVQCGVVAARNYRPGYAGGRSRGSPRLCSPCVEGVTDAI